MINKMFVKRVADITIATCGIAIASPVMAAVALGEILEHRNFDIIFQQKRLGKDGIPFRVLKFKTIKNARDENNKWLPEEHPKRKTPFLRMLRKTGLDELPQLFNIVKGDMSLVGPRPYPTGLISPGDYKRSPIIQERQSVRPGLFNVNHMIPHARNVDWLERLENDVTYVRELDVVYDFKVIAKSLLTMVGHGHHEAGVPIPFKRFRENSPEILSLEQKIAKSRAVSATQKMPLFS